MRRRRRGAARLSAVCACACNSLQLFAPTLHTLAPLASPSLQVVVEASDPAFQRPTKQVGPHYSRQEAERLAADKGWAVAPDGDAFRRVVASPLPKDIVEWRSVQVLLQVRRTGLPCAMLARRRCPAAHSLRRRGSPLPGCTATCPSSARPTPTHTHARTSTQAGVICVACGGGGIPVVEDAASGERRGVEAVVDKDEASALLASKLGADWLLMLTDAPAIYDPAAWPREKRPLPSPVPCSQLQQAGFEAGSMAPKVAAACRFASTGGGRAGVGAIADALAILQGRAGTVITAG